MKKVCPQCKKNKPFSEYYKSGIRLDGVSSWCRSCDRLKAKERTKEDSRRYRITDTENRVERKRALRKIADAAKNMPCVVCGQQFHPCAMDFHHKNEDEKSREVSRLVGMGCSQDRLIKEIAKCEVLCAVCHRIRHKDSGTLREFTND